MQRAILTLALAVSACDFPTGDLGDPATWGSYFLDKYAAERAAAMSLEPGPAPLAQPRSVLLITGVTIPKAWFDPIAARLRRDGFRPFVYEPPALLSGDLFENSERLATVVDEIRARTGEEKIDILAECTGGLIARHYIQALGGDRTVSRLVTFISPQHGVAKAPLAAATVGWPALYDLSPGSRFLRAVNEAPLPPNVAVTSIYTCTDEYIQPYQTSIIPGATNIGLCQRFVGHFQFFYDPAIYRIMHLALTAGDENAPVDPSPAAITPPDAGGEGTPVPASASDPDHPELGGCAAAGGPADGSLALGLVAALAALLLARRWSRRGARVPAGR